MKFYVVYISKTPYIDHKCLGYFRFKGYAKDFAFKLANKIKEYEFKHDKSIVVNKIDDETGGGFIINILYNNEFKKEENIDISIVDLDTIDKKYIDNLVNQMFYYYKNKISPTDKNELSRNEKMALKGVINGYSFDELAELFETDSDSIKNDYKNSLRKLKLDNINIGDLSKNQKETNSEK